RREALAARPAARTAATDHPAAQGTGRVRSGRTDDHALLPPDPAAVVGQDLGTTGNARLRAAAAPGVVRRGRPDAPGAGRRVPQTTVRREAQRHVAFGRF